MMRDMWIPRIEFKGEVITWAQPVLAYDTKEECEQMFLDAFNKAHNTKYTTLQEALK